MSSFRKRIPYEDSGGDAWIVQRVSLDGVFITIQAEEAGALQKERIHYFTPDEARQVAEALLAASHGQGRKANENE